MGEKGDQQKEQDCLGHVARRSSTDSLWLCYAKPLVGKQKSGIWLTAKTEADLLGENEEEPTSERRREYTDLGGRDEHVACHATALVLAVTHEACWEAEMEARRSSSLL